MNPTKSIVLEISPNFYEFKQFSSIKTDYSEQEILFLISDLLNKFGYLKKSEILTPDNLNKLGKSILTKEIEIIDGLDYFNIFEELELIFNIKFSTKEILDIPEFYLSILIIYDKITNYLIPEL